MSNDPEILDYEKGDRPIYPHAYAADGGKRFLNYILDRVGIYILFFGLGALMDGNAIDEDLFGLSILIIVPCYYILTEYFWGKTPAKFITKTTVVTQYGNPPSLLNIIGRTLCRLIPFEQFSFLGSNAVGWHDSISKTRVVNDSFFASRNENSVLSDLVDDDDESLVD